MSAPAMLPVPASSSVMTTVGLTVSTAKLVWACALALPNASTTASALSLIRLDKLVTSDEVTVSVAVQVLVSGTCSKALNSPFSTSKSEISNPVTDSEKLIVTVVEPSLTKVSEASVMVATGAWVSTL
jgi:hypothetical protein